MARQTLQRDVLDAIGGRIVSGDYAPGQVLRTEDLEVEHNVSRTVLRETLKVLESMHLIGLRRRIGITVREHNEWNVFDPRIIRWRLSGSTRPAQLKSLTELRLAIEPVAARMAAVHATSDQRLQVMKLSQALERTAVSGDLETFLHHDIEFHALLLKASGNEMFAALSDAIAEVLTGRTVHHLMPDHPDPEARRLHRLVATSIAEADPSGAETAMRGVLSEVTDHMVLPLENDF